MQKTHARRTLRCSDSVRYYTVLARRKHKEERENDMCSEEQGAIKAHFLSPSISGRSFVMAITVAKMVTKTVMKRIDGLPSQNK